ncbi:MAG: PilZ domain-containing protein [Gemmataceae bacterium]
MSPHGNALEKRRFIRYPCRVEQRKCTQLEGLACHCYLLRAADVCRVVEAPTLLGRILNLSRGGLALHVGVHFQLGEAVFVVLRCGSRCFRLEAHVVRSVEQYNGTFILGVEFDEQLADEPIDVVTS